MKVLVVGQAPARGRTGDRAFPPDTPSGRRLAAMFGVDDVACVADAVNLLGQFPGDCSWHKGHAFPVSKARRKAARIRLRGYDVVVLAGRNVARAFGFEARPFLEWFELRGVRGVVVPHPSGANHWWNDRRRRAKAERLLRRIAEISGV